VTLAEMRAMVAELREASLPTVGGCYVLPFAESAAAEATLELIRCWRARELRRRLGPWWRAEKKRRRRELRQSSRSVNPVRSGGAR
jgi:hypothetical protein